MSERLQKSWGQLGPLGKVWRFLNEDIIDSRKIDLSQFGKTYRKRAMTVARLLTKQDYKEGVPENGEERTAEIVHTNEGDKPFKVGDLLARDRLGVYPIPADFAAATKESIDEPDQEGWRRYRAKTTIRAQKMPRSFRVKTPSGGTLHGKRHDELGIEDVQGKRSVRVLDKGIFEETYGPETPESK